MPRRATSRSWSALRSRCLSPMSPKSQSADSAGGGIANLFAAARDNRIDALVCFDGSLRYYPGLVKQAADVHPEQMTIPLIFFTQGEFTLEDQIRFLNDPAKNQGPSVLNTWTHGNLITVHMLGMMHQEFSSMYQHLQCNQEGELRIQTRGTGAGRLGRQVDKRQSFKRSDCNSLAQCIALSGFERRLRASRGRVF